MRPVLFLPLVLSVAPGAARAQTAQPVLEKYNLQFASPATAGQSPGAEIRLRDRFFGNGTATCRIELIEQSSSSTPADRPMMLFLQAARQVQPDEVVFALLVFGVEIRGYNEAGQVIYSRNLPGFRFGDSQGGLWYERLAGLPTALARLEITFYGNYE